MLSASDKAKLRMAGVSGTSDTKQPESLRMAENQAAEEDTSKEQASNEVKEDAEAVPDGTADEAFSHTQPEAFKQSADVPVSGLNTDLIVFPSLFDSVKSDPGTGDIGITYRKNPGETPVRPAAKEKYKGMRKAVTIKNIPASLVDMCKRSCQDTSAPNNKTICAFLYAFRDRAFDGFIDYSDVPDDVVAFAKTFDLAKEKAEFDRRVSSIERNIRSISNAQMQSLWALIYLVWDAAGLRNDHPRSPDEIGFSQSQEGFDITFEMLNEAVKKYMAYEKQKEGRPIH